MNRQSAKRTMPGFAWAIMITVAIASIAAAQDSSSQAYLSRLKSRELQEALKKPRFGAGLPYDTVSRPRDPKAEAALHRLRKETGVNWGVRNWSNTTGGASSISPDAVSIRKGLTPGRGATLREKAENFVKDYGEIFLPLSPPGTGTQTDLRFLWERDREVRFWQYSQGLPVFLSYLQVGFFYGSISGAGGHVFVLPEIETSPVISQQDAVRAIRESGAYGARKVHLPSSGELVIYPSRPPRLAWSFKSPGGPRAFVMQAHILVDARNGEVLLGPRATADDVASPRGIDSPGGGGGNLPDGGDSKREDPKPQSSDPTLRTGPGRLDPTEFFFTLTDSLDFDKTAFARRLLAESPERYRHADSVMKARFRNPGALKDGEAPRGPTRPQFSDRKYIELLPRQSYTPPTKRGRGAVKEDGHGDRPDLSSGGENRSSTTVAVDDLAVVPGLDHDGDGYARDAHLGVDLDIDPGQQLEVFLDIWGYGPNGGSYIGATPNLWIIGTDNLYDEVYLPGEFQHGLWDFAIDVFRASDGAYIGWTDFGDFAAASGIPLESYSEDPLYTFGGPTSLGIRDDDYDGSHCIYLLQWDIDVDAGIHTIFSELYLQDEFGTEEYLYTTDPYTVTDNNFELQSLIFAGRPQGQYDIAMVLFDAGSGAYAGELQFGTWANWTDRPLETGEEDRGPSQVFDPNPVNTLNDNTLQDWDDADLPVFAPAYETITLTNLNDPAVENLRFYELCGPYVCIEDLPGYTGPENAPAPLLPGSPSYRYTRDQPGFEATMCYFHINRNQEYLQSIIPFSVNNRQISVDHRGAIEEDATPGQRSYYQGDGSGTGSLYFGWLGVDDAEDADVIIHEYAHACIDNLNANIFTNSLDFLARAIMEGTADYWACSSLRDVGNPGFPTSYLGEWYAKSNGELFLRDLDNTYTQFHSDCNCCNGPEDEHCWGRIWGGALWDIEAAIGKTATGVITFEGLDRREDPNPTFEDVAKLILGADTIYYGGIHTAAIIAAFDAREIYIGACDCPHQGDMTGDGFVDSIDLSLLIDATFFGGDDPQDPYCPITRCDFNGDGYTDSLDLSVIIDHIFFGGDIAVDPCP